MEVYAWLVIQCLNFVCIVGHGYCFLCVSRITLCAMYTCWARMQKQWQSIIYAFWCISIVPQLDLYILHMSCMLCVCTQAKYISCRYSVLVCTFYIWATCLLCISLICILFILFWPMGILRICCIFYIFMWQWYIIYFMMHVCAHFMVPRPRILWIGNSPLPRLLYGLL